MLTQRSTVTSVNNHSPKELDVTEHENLTISRSLLVTAQVTY